MKNKNPKTIQEWQKTNLKLYDVQPSWTRHPLIRKDKLKVSKEIERVLYFDPTPIYDRLNELNLLNPYQRNVGVMVGVLFPKVGNKCGCGCGVELTGKQTRWASTACCKFVGKVFEIINGYTSTIRWYLRRYNQSNSCGVCKDNSFDVVIEVDHILAVVNGGGGCWLSGFELKCKPCHQKKTRIDLKQKVK